jgi:hypothetical protein
MTNILDLKIIELGKILAVLELKKEETGIFGTW